MSEFMTVDVLGADGAKKGTAELPGDLFDVQTNVPLIHQVVVAQQAAARQGTHSTKTRAQVRGGGAKPWRQKGTGRARQGSRRAPQWVGGGVVFGPHPRDYSQRTPKKMIAAALRGALSDRAREGRLFVVDCFVNGDAPSTKTAVKVLGTLGDFARVLVVLDREEASSWMSLRNVLGVHVLAYDQLNAYDVLVGDAVVFSKTALDGFVAGPAKGKSVKAVATQAEAQALVAAVAKDALVKHPKATAAVVRDETPEDDAKDYGEGSYRGIKPPKGFDIKGNEDSMKFHTSESPYYSRTVAEVWFNSVEVAEAAGFVSAAGDEGAEKEDAK